jgi:hypothetical protein
VPRPAAPRARWWSRSRGLPAAAYDDWRRSVTTVPARSARILAWAEAEPGYVVASPAVLSVLTGPQGSGASDPTGATEATVPAPAWLHVGWHEIENGGWNAELNQLRWARYADAPPPRRGAVTLTAPGRLPETFRERVAASIVVERFLPVSGERGVTLHGRRDLAQRDPVIAWHASLGRGLSWRTPGLRQTVDEELAELRLEYDPGQVP